MIELNIPGKAKIKIEHLVLDYNGTLAFDGKLISSVRPLLESLAKDLQIHVLTADTFGFAASELKGVKCRIVILESTGQQEAKLRYIENLGKEHVAAIGNGCNDMLMLREAALSIVVIQKEGAALETLLSAKIVCADITDALDLLFNPKRIYSTLRV